MPCSEKEIQFQPGQVSPGSPVPGFGIPFSPIQSPSPELQLPTEVIEDVLGLVEKLSLVFPSGIIKPNADLKMKSVLDAVANLMTQAAPYLSLYNFFLAALKLIKCILEVLCAIPNPLAMARKMKTLFTECLPPFLALFPWAALPIMILSLLRAILALLEYILLTFRSIIETTLLNLAQLAESIALQDADGTLAATQKIAGLLCFLDNIFAIFTALNAIFDIIRSLAALAGGAICGDDSDCCLPENCPNFIKLFPNGHVVTTGQLIYHPKIKSDVDALVPGLSDLLNLDPKRLERWQVIDLEDSEYKINSIITPINGKIFWPDELQVLFSDSSLKKAPYLVDLKITAPFNLLNPSLPSQSRQLFVKDVIVRQKPYLGLLNYKNEISNTNLSGTFSLLGGKVYESNQATPFLIDGKQATLETLIHHPEVLTVSGFPVFEDALTFPVEFTWKPNHEALIDYKLITIGCYPAVANEKNIQNAIQDAEGSGSFLDQIFPNQIPDLLQTQKCLQNSLNELRKEVSPEKVLQFQSSGTLCLESLQLEIKNLLCQTLLAAFSPFQSKISLSTDLQFLTSEIIIFIELKDQNKNLIFSGNNDSCLDFILSQLEIISTLGEVSFLEMNQGQLLFKLISSQAGSGTITAKLNQQQFSLIIPGEGEENTKIIPQEVEYSFIDALPLPKPRRDEKDISELS